MTAELSVDTATVGLGVGLVLALLCHLVTSLSPGGMITPGWLAVALLQDWQHALVIGAMTVATYGATVLLQRVTILYGRRLFATTVLLGVLLQATLLLVVGDGTVTAYQTLGFVVPGLIVYQLRRQPQLATLAATAVVSALTAAALALAALA